MKNVDFGMNKKKKKKKEKIEGGKRLAMKKKSILNRLDSRKRLLNGIRLRKTFYFRPLSSLS